MPDVEFIGATALTKSTTGGAFSIAMPAYEAGDIVVLMQFGRNILVPKVNGGNSWGSAWGWSSRFVRGFDLTLRSRVLTGNESPTSIDYDFGPDDGYNWGWFQALVFRVPNYSSTQPQAGKDEDGAGRRTITFAPDPQQNYQKVEVVAAASCAWIATNGIDLPWAATAPPTYTNGLTDGFVEVGTDTSEWVWPNFPNIDSKLSTHFALYYRLDRYAADYADDTVTWDWAAPYPNDSYWDAGYSRQVLRTTNPLSSPPPPPPGAPKLKLGKVQITELPYQVHTQLLGA
jgi:hypothetical protein